MRVKNRRYALQQRPRIPATGRQMHIGWGSDIWKNWSFPYNNVYQNTTSEVSANFYCYTLVPYYQGLKVDNIKYVDMFVTDAVATSTDGWLAIYDATTRNKIADTGFGAMSALWNAVADGTWVTAELTSTFTQTADVYVVIYSATSTTPALAGNSLNPDPEYWGYVPGYYPQEFSGKINTGGLAAIPAAMCIRTDAGWADFFYPQFFGLRS